MGGAAKIITKPLQAIGILPKPPKPPPPVVLPPPPPPPAPPPAPSFIFVQQPAPPPPAPRFEPEPKVEEAAEKAKKSLRGKGRKSTIKTSPQGDTSPTPGKRKVLFGG